MRPLLILLFITGCIVQTTSQIYFPFVDTGKVWSTYHFYYTGSQFSEFIKFKNDTLVDGKLYKIAWSSLDTNMTSWTISSFIREDSLKKVYHRYPNSDGETIIYDFNVQAGDTVELRQDEYDTSLYVVDSIDWVTMLDGNHRQRFHLTSIDYSFCNESWIEGMGCTKGVFEGGTCGFVGDDASLICFSQNDTLLYFNPAFNQCYVITDIEDPMGYDGEINLFPNPVTETLTVRINKNETAEWDLKLDDLSGKEVAFVPLTKSETLINLRHFYSQQGYFIFTLFCNGSMVKSGKVILLK